MKNKKARPARSRPNMQSRVYLDPDDSYFKKHFAALVREHGGEWIVLAEGKLIGIGKKKEVPHLIEKARAGYPNSTLFLAPIPTKEDIECVL